MHQPLLSGKCIVIIGGTSGIGLSASRAMIAQGAKLVIVGGLEETSQEAASLLGSNAFVITADARDAGTAHKAIESCKDQFGGFHGLYHVAGGSGRRLGDGPLHELSLDGWNQTLEMNLTALMLSNRAAVQQLRKSPKGGAILNIGSVLGYAPSSRHFATHAYAAAKAAVIGFSKSIAAYYAPDNIRVNVLAPGLVNTPMASRAAADESIQSFIKTKQPLEGGRMGEPTDLDGLAIYFMSDQSKFTTGQVIGVDGGWEVSEGQYGKRE
jgi:NAD(P)-dependent dehydrogenase (short-subunit alcohol dehydrogenase family)